MDIQEQMDGFTSNHSFLEKLNEEYSIQLENILNGLTESQNHSLILLIAVMKEIQKQERQISYKVGFSEGFHYNRRKRKESK